MNKIKEIDEYGSKNRYDILEKAQKQLMVYDYVDVMKINNKLKKKGVNKHG